MTPYEMFIISLILELCLYVKPEIEVVGVGSTIVWTTVTFSAYAYAQKSIDVSHFQWQKD